MQGFTYEFQISASPRPYHIGQEIKLSCSISPQAVVRHDAIWSVEYNQILYQMTTEQSGNWSWTVSSDAYQSGIWFCTAYINDFIVTGAMEVTINGEIDAILF